MIRQIVFALALVGFTSLTFAQSDLRSVGEKRDSSIIVELTKENDLLRRQLAIVSARCQ